MTRILVVDDDEQMNQRRVVPWAQAESGAAFLGNLVAPFPPGVALLREDAVETPGAFSRATIGDQYNVWGTESSSASPPNILRRSVCSLYSPGSEL